MPRFEKALAEFRRVLKPGGTLAVTVWHSTTHVPFFKTLMEFCHSEALLKFLYNPGERRCVVPGRMKNRWRAGAGG